MLLAQLVVDGFPKEAEDMARSPFLIRAIEPHTQLFAGLAFWGRVAVLQRVVAAALDVQLGVGGAVEIQSYLVVAHARFDVHCRHLSEDDGEIVGRDLVKPSGEEAEGEAHDHDVALERGPLR